MSEELTKYETTAMSVSEVQAQVAEIQRLMKAVMHDGQHYGTIPGCGPKPTLLKAGAEKICLMFRLAPTYDVIERDLPNGHREYRVTCGLSHIVSGQKWGEGIGMASSMESKHRYRGGSRTCPKCGQEAIIKGKEEYGGGWLCFSKRGGCGEKFLDDDPVITSQVGGKTENADPTDTFNTVLKMGKKRALTDAVLTATAASDIFTQDLDDIDANRKAAGGVAFAPPVTLMEPRDKTAPLKPNGSPQPEPTAPPNSDAPKGARAAHDQQITFGKDKGTYLSEMTIDKLEWYIDMFRQGIADPQKAKHKAQNQDMMDACHTELGLRARAIDGPGAEG